MNNGLATKSPMTRREDAVVILQDQFRRRANTLACGDFSLADDLVGIMCASVMQNGETIATLGYYANGAVNDARDACRKHRLRNDESLKRRYQPGDARPACKEKPDVKLCVRQAGTGSAKRKVGRPRSEQENGPKVMFAIRCSEVVKKQFAKLARKRGVTHEMLLRGAAAMLLVQDGEHELARKFIDMGEEGAAESQREND